MSLIIRSGARKQTNKQAYTWAACILVSVFLVSIAVPFLGGKKEQSGQDYMEKAYDLAQLPFTNDAATEALLQADKYKDVAKKDLIGTLFSKKDKEKRQQEDKVNGAPAAPDDEYKQAQIQKEKIAERQAAIARRTAGATVTPTATGSLSSGHMVSGGGASSGVTANIWRSDDKEGSTNRGSSGAGSGLDMNKAQLLASIKSGRGTGFVDATLKSSAAAKSKNLDSAAAGAVNAFQQGAQAKKDEVKTDLEKQAEDLTMDPGAEVAKLAASNIPALDDATKKIEQKKRDNDLAACKNMFASWNCFLSQIAEKALGMVVNAGESALTSKWGGENPKSEKGDKNGSGSGAS